MSIEIYGASDDLVEVDGDISEEFNPGEGPSYIAVSDGTVLRITYDGMWHIIRVQEGECEYSHRAATNEDDDYSDRVTISAGDRTIGWVVFGDRFEASS